MTAGAHGSSAWADAAMVAALFAVDPVGLGGVVLRGRAGPVRDAWLELLRDLLPDDAPVRRSPLHIGDDRLLGGLDLSASLAAGRPVAQRGVLADADGGVVLLPMAERLADATGARIAAVLDDGEVIIERDGMAARNPARFGVVAFDEGVEPEERPPSALMERCAFRIDADDINVRDLSIGDVDRRQILDARKRAQDIGAASDALIESLCAAATAFGVGSARAPLLTLRAARAVAALDGRDQIALEDVTLAARLVLAPRALTFPESQVEEQHGDSREEEPTNARDAGSSDDQRDKPANMEPPTDMIIAATHAALPEDILKRLRSTSRDRARAVASGAGAQVLSPHRGRPVASRGGALRAGERLNLVETLRAAAPWQKLRRAGGADTSRIAVRRADFRIRRFVEQRESTTIFVVDASGSAAFQRLAEAKGAVELLLADAYVSRARVALVSFRATSAEILLPATRSLTRARRQLADLPGGGGTPLAHGLEAALQVALGEKRKGRTPLLLLLTDGRANIARDGSPGRPRAEEDALSVARLVRAAGIAAIHVDTSPRPRPGADCLAREMGATYAPLPYLDARAVRSLVQTAPPPLR